MASNSEFVPKTIKLDKRTLRVSVLLEKKLGLAFSSVVRLALAKLAEAEGINKAA